MKESGNTRRGRIAGMRYVESGRGRWGGATVVRTAGEMETYANALIQGVLNRIAYGHNAPKLQPRFTGNAQQALTH